MNVAAAQSPQSVSPHELVEGGVTVDCSVREGSVIIDCSALPSHAETSGPRIVPDPPEPQDLQATCIDRTADCEPPTRSDHHDGRAEVWGVAGLAVYAFGTRVAPNGVPFNPLFALDLQLNVGLLPKKKLYIFVDNGFWAQRATAGVTNQNQGALDFSKREDDVDFGLAWNLFNSLELRAWAYGLNNLNRGWSATKPSGFSDGAVVEARYYFRTADIYDLGRLNFVGLGYYPTTNSQLVGGSGQDFHPGLSARAYLTTDLPLGWFPSYAYADAKVTSEQSMTPRLFEADVGLALRPFTGFKNLEFRLGDDVTRDLRVNTTRNLVYSAVRIEY